MIMLIHMMIWYKFVAILSLDDLISFFLMKWESKIIGITIITQIIV